MYLKIYGASQGDSTTKRKLVRHTELLKSSPLILGSKLEILR
jgi:hypothetical protein